MPKKRKLSFTMPKGVMDEPPEPKQRGGLRGTRSVLMMEVDREGYAIRFRPKQPGDRPCVFDYDDDGNRIVVMMDKPRHPTDFPRTRWWNDPALNHQIPEGVKGEDRIKYLIAGDQRPPRCEDPDYVDHYSIFVETVQ